LSAFADPSTWVALATLTALEIVLGVDNIIFISILASRLPSSRQASARRLGLLLAMGACQQQSEGARQPASQAR